MTMNEVLVFKEFQAFKGVDESPHAPVKTCFNTPINDPNTKKKAEKTKNSEFRVRVFFK